MLNLMSKRYWFFGFSILIITAGIIAMLVWGLPFSNEFTGGSLLEAKFLSGKAPATADVVSLYRSLGYDDAQVVTSGADVLIIRTGLLPEGALTGITDAINSKFNDKLEVMTFDNVGPTLAQELTQRGILVVLVASVVLAIYITFAFRGVPKGYRFGICTVAALIHDVLIMLSVAAITGHFLGWEVDTLFLTAMLTVIAFSAQDTIVVFDRIRENSGIYKRLNVEALVNHSIVQTLTRSVNTQIVVVDFLLLAVALFGAATLQKFAIYLLIGMLSGSYSSDFNAAPLLIVWENKEWKTWFRRNKSNNAEAAAS